MKKYFTVALAILFINTGRAADEIGEHTSAFEREIIGNRCRNLICDVMLSSWPFRITTHCQEQILVCRKCFKHYFITYPNAPEIRIKDEYGVDRRSRIMEIDTGITGIIEKPYFCFNSCRYYEEKNMKLLAKIWKEAPPKGKNWNIDLKFMWEAARRLDSEALSLPFEEGKIEEEDSMQGKITFKVKNSKSCTIQ